MHGEKLARLVKSVHTHIMYVDDNIINLQPFLAVVLFFGIYCSKKMTRPVFSSSVSLGFLMPAGIIIIASRLWNSKAELEWL